MSRLGRRRDRRHDGRVPRARGPRRDVRRQRREHVARSIGPGSASPGRSPSSRSAFPRSRRTTLSGEWDTIMLATKAHHTEAATRALLPHLSATGCVISVQNGLNELAIAEVVGAERTVGAFVNFGADYMEPGVILYGGRGAVVVGEIDGRVTPRVTAIRDAWLDFDDRADRHVEHLGLPVGQGSVRRDAVRDRAHQRIDRRCARDAGVSRSVHRARARDSRGGGGARRHAGGVRRVRPGRVSARCASRRGRGDRSTISSRTIARQPRRTAASGATSPCASGRTEVDAQLGIVVALGRDAGVPTPLTARLVELIHEIEHGRRPQSLETLDVLAAHARDATDRMNIEFTRPDGHRHRRRARIWSRDRAGVRRARRTRLGVRRARRRARRDARVSAERRRNVHRARGGRERQGRRRCVRRATRRRRRGAWTSWSTTPAACLGRSDARSRTSRPPQWQSIFDVNVTGAFYLCAGRGAGNEGGAPRAHHQHLERRRTRHQPHRNPGVCVGEGGADRPDAAARARARAVGHHGEQHRAGIRAIQSRDRAAVGIVRRRGPARADRSHRAQAARARRRTSRTACCSLRRDHAGWITGQVLSIDGGK